MISTKLDAYSTSAEQVRAWNRSKLARQALKEVMKQELLFNLSLIDEVDRAPQVLNSVVLKHLCDSGRASAEAHLVPLNRIFCSRKILQHRDAGNGRYQH